MRLHALLCAGLVGAFAPSLTAQSTLVAPDGYATTPASNNNAYPWNRGASSMRIQFVYDSTNFTNQGVTGPVLINNLRYRPYPGTATTSWAGGSWPNVRVDMATCPLDFQGVSSTFANNLGGDLTTVHQGQVVVAPGSCLGAGVVVPWYIDIALSTPFVYDPGNGDLTVDIHLDGTGWSGTSRAAEHAGTTSSPPAMSSRIYDTTGLTGTTGSVGLNYGAVCEFGYAPAAGLYPAFTATPRSGASPLQVQFTDNSYSSDPSGISAWLWDFDNDGTYDSTVQNPIHTYTNCGDYSVRLTVIDATHGPVTLTKQDYISTDHVTASFTTALLAPGVYQFTDTSTPTPTSWAWDFEDDGIIDSTLQNPAYAVGTACSTTVRLTATLNCRSDSAAQTLLLAPLSHSANLAGGTGTTSTTAVGNLFDLQVLAGEGVSVCGLTGITYTGTGPYTVSVYVTDGSYVGKDTNAAAWRLVATGQAMMNGGSTTVPSVNEVPLDSPFYLPAGNYGVAVYHDALTGSAYIGYTNATSGPYANGDLVIHPAPAAAPGIGKTALFGGTTYTPRQWNGTFHYTKQSVNHQAGYGFFGLS
ncbi:MAG: PKD domain-containing protein [Planctomycetes bacterium]|nr:PKD domain-containing protein [Planctomycetota bacterium]